MTDWHNPSHILSEYNAFVKLIHFLGGLYIWEILVNLDFEYAILTRKRKFRASLLLYFLARWFPLVTIAMMMAGQGASYMDCQVYIPFVYLSTYLTFLFAASLFVLRIVAIWERNKIAIAVASTMWLINLAACIHGAATIKSVWVEAIHACGVLEPLKTRTALLFIFITEVVLLILMLTGLLRWKSREKSSVWYLLFTQGVAWVAVTAVADIPPLIFIFLNLNDAIDLITQLPGPFIVSIAATRMYRGLSDYLGRTDIFHLTHVGAGGQSNTTPFGNFVAPSSSSPDVVTISHTGGVQTQSDVAGSLTVASSDTTEKAARGGDETV